MSTVKQRQKSVAPASKAAPGQQEALVPATIVKPVDNAIKIMRYLSLIGKPSTVTLIARELKINPSTCFNILRTLAWTGMLEFDPQTKTYTSGLGAVDLANRALLKGGSVISHVQPQLDRVAHEHGITITVWRRIGENRMMLAALIEGPATLRIHARLGQRLPLLAGAGGRIMAAFGELDDEEIKRRLPQIRWNRTPSATDYLAQVKQARETGWAIDDGDYLPGVMAIAAPIIDIEGRLRGVVTATLVKGQHPKRAISKIVHDIKHVASAFTMPLPQAFEMEG